MVNLDQYRHKEVWSKEGKDFCIEVVRWELSIPDGMESLLGSGKYIWNIYYYLYPAHPLFSKSKSEDDCPLNEFHGGCTYEKWHCNTAGKITSKEYGCDYNHWGDEFFTHSKMSDTVFCDAEELYEKLSNVSMDELR